MCQSFDGFVIFTACQRSCGKVMFLLACVCRQGGGYAWFQVHSGGIQEGRWVCQGVGYPRGRVGMLGAGIQEGGAVYGWQAGGTHPTGMLSFQFYLFTSIHQKYFSSIVFFCILNNAYFQMCKFISSKAPTRTAKFVQQGVRQDREVYWTNVFQS